RRRDRKGRRGVTTVASMRPALFVSDLHLAPQRPALVAAFRAFCAGPAREASALYVLGDLFDAWVGAGQLTGPLGPAVAASLRAAFVRWLRRTSRRESARKPAAIMDVNAGAVADALRAHGVRRMIHGHTHRPAQHALVVDGTACERIVLADWYGRASYLEVDA